jgi:glutamate formiminotransferase/formiminotetrahydrofolate cyclodeaminase
MKIIECVPNFSEGRNPDTLAFMKAAVASTSSAKLLGFEPDHDYNRTVVTLAGDEKGILESVLAISEAAAEKIDMRQHSGEHPRLGAIDVVPFVPVRNVTMDECVALANEYGRIIATRLHVPVFLYEEAAKLPYRKNLADIRKGEYEGLENKLKDPAWQPDYGNAEANPKTGGIVTGARFFLVAYNVNLKTEDVSYSKEIAEVLRESGRVKKDADGNVIKIDGKSIKEPGRLQCVKGMGVKLDNYHITQVSMNLTNFMVTPIHVAFEEAKKEAARLGVEVNGSEIVGLTPLAALLDAGKFYADGKSYSEEDLVKLAIEKLGLSTLAPFDPGTKIIDYLI